MGVSLTDKVRMIFQQPKVAVVKKILSKRGASSNENCAERK